MSEDAFTPECQDTIWIIGIPTFNKQNNNINDKVEQRNLVPVIANMSLGKFEANIVVGEAILFDMFNDTNTFKIKMKDNLFLDDKNKPISIPLQKIKISPHRLVTTPGKEIVDYFQIVEI